MKMTTNSLTAALLTLALLLGPGSPAEARS